MLTHWPQGDMAVSLNVEHAWLIDIHFMSNWSRCQTKVFFYILQKKCLIVIWVSCVWIVHCLLLGPVIRWFEITRFWTLISNGEHGTKRSILSVFRHKWTCCDMVELYKYTFLVRWEGFSVQKYLQLVRSWVWNIPVKTKSMSCLLLALWVTRSSAAMVSTM